MKFSNNTQIELQGVADTVLEIIKKADATKSVKLDEAITRSVKDGVTTVSYTGDDAKNHSAGNPMNRAKKLAQMGMKNAAAAKKRQQKEETVDEENAESLNEYTPGSGGVTRVKGKSYGAGQQSNTDIADNNSQASGPLSMKGPSDKDLKKIDRDNKLDAKKPFSQMREAYAQNGLKSLQQKYNDLSVTPGQSAKPAFYADKQTDGVDHQTDNTRSATEKNQDQYEAEMKKNQKFMSQRKTDKEEAASGSVPSNIRVTVRNESAPMSTVTNEDIHEPLDEMFPRSFTGGTRVLKNSKELSPAQQEIDVHDDNKIDGKDFKKLRSMKKEGVFDKLKNKVTQTTNKLANKMTQHTMKQLAKNPKDMAKFQQAQQAGVFNMQQEGDSPEADYAKNMKHHVMKDTVAMKKKGMSGLEPVTEKEAYFDNVIAEKKMTDDEEEHKEYIVKGMKKNLKSFKDTYGKDAKNVMYATATKLAQKDESYGMIKASKKQKNEAEAVDGYDKCWDGYRKDGTKPGTGKNTGKRVNNCVKEDAVKKAQKTDKYGTPILTPAQKKESDARRARAKAQYMRNDMFRTDYSNRLSDNQR